jgi:hypothetical protein
VSDDATIVGTQPERAAKRPLSAVTPSFSSYLASNTVSERIPTTRQINGLSVAHSRKILVELNMLLKIAHADGSVELRVLKDLWAKIGTIEKRLGISNKETQARKKNKKRLKKRRKNEKKRGLRALADAKKNEVLLSFSTDKYFH